MARWIIVHVLIVYCCLGWSCRDATAAEQARPAQRTPVADTTTATKERKWNVGRQLVQNMPYGSEKRGEAQLLAYVKMGEPTGDQRLVLALNDLGAWYRGQRRFPDAETVYKRVLKMQLDRTGGHHHDVALSHNDLGVVYTDAGKYSEAEQQFKRALETWDKTWDMPLKTEDNAVAFHNYAVLLEKMGRGAEARSMEGKAEDIAGGSPVLIRRSPYRRSSRTTGPSSRPCRARPSRSRGRGSRH